MPSRLIGVAARSAAEPGLGRLLARLDEVAPGVERLVVEGLTVAQARNAQVAHAVTGGAEVLVLVDADQLPAQADWLDRLVRPVESGEADVVSGPVVPVRADHPAARWLAALERGLFREIPTDPSLALNCNAAFRVAALAALPATAAAGRGPFDESLARGGEDWDLDERLLQSGARFRFEPSAVVLHDYSAVRWPVALRKRYRYCVGGALARLRNGTFAASAPGALARTAAHPLELPVKATALARAALLHYCGR